MTRINAGIRPYQLTRQHLLAEHREIKRIPNHVFKFRDRIDIKAIPPVFKLGTGHVKFFYNKIKYLQKRYTEIYNECIKRGYNVTDYSESFGRFAVDSKLHTLYFQDWVETKEATELIEERINERLQNM